jgi:hypothetical protein
MWSNDDAPFVINCPSTIVDHRVVLIGQLADATHYPAVFVRPEDEEEWWYPQNGHHNPLRAGRAFACFVHIGNPNGIWQLKELPLAAEVRVCALAGEWRHGSDRLDTGALDERLSKIGNLMEMRRNITRISLTVDGVTISDQSGSKGLFHGPRPIPCTAPIRFDWDSNVDARIEVRKGFGDNWVDTKTVRPGARLVIDAAQKGANDIRLPGAGKYRVRLYPLKVSFVDPSHEWWLDIDGSSPP